MSESSAMDVDRSNIVTKFNTIVKNQTLSKKIEESVYKYSCSKANEYKWNIDWTNVQFRRIYMNKARSNFMNLDKKSSIGNSDFLKRIKSGEIDATRVAFMLPTQVFPKHWEKMQARKKASDNYLYCKQLAPETDKYFCAKCHKNRCTSFEVLLHSSDEPMSTLVECLECGHNWQF